MADKSDLQMQKLVWFKRIVKVKHSLESLLDDLIGTHILG